MTIPQRRVSLDAELRRGLRVAISNARRELVPYTGNTDGNQTAYETRREIVPSRNRWKAAA